MPSTDWPLLYPRRRSFDARHLVREQQLALASRPRAEITMAVQRLNRPASSRHAFNFPADAWLDAGGHDRLSRRESDLATLIHECKHPKAQLSVDANATRGGASGRIA